MRNTIVRKGKSLYQNLPARLLNRTDDELRCILSRRKCNFYRRRAGKDATADAACTDSAGTSDTPSSKTNTFPSARDMGGRTCNNTLSRSEKMRKGYDMGSGVSQAGEVVHYNAAQFEPEAKQIGLPPSVGYKPCLLILSAQPRQRDDASSA